MDLLPSIKEIKQTKESIVTKEYLLLIENELDYLTNEKNKYMGLYTSCHQTHTSYKRKMRKYEWIDKILQFLLNIPRNLFRRT